jgi:copper chaperone CopZ
MTCDACENKVKSLLEKTEGVTKVTTDRTKQEAVIEMSTHVSTDKLRAALKDVPKYQLSDKHATMSPTAFSEEEKSWFETYKPILLVFAFITGVTLLIQASNERFEWMQWMNHFMAGFFTVFSFFKLLNLRGFADSYATYDIVAKRWKAYGYIYPFIELALGLAYLTHFKPLLTTMITAVVMAVSLVGVLQTVLNKRKIRCACLGDVFNLPMSTITVIEDGLMLVMAVAMHLSLHHA